MLTPDDVSWIKMNRAEILANRTIPIKVWFTVEYDIRKNPVTKEPIEGDPAVETVEVVWKEFLASGSELEMIGGVVLENGDVRITFPEGYDLSAVRHVENDGILYKIVAKDRRGLGGENRVETVVRRSS